VTNILRKGQRVRSTSGQYGTVISQFRRLTRYQVDGCSHPSLIPTWALIAVSA
jgi:hypothetical protein